MNSFCTTYNNKSNLLVDLEVSLLATLTPPYKDIDNQLINRYNAVENHIRRYHLAYYARCVTPFCV